MKKLSSLALIVVLTGLLRPAQAAAQDDYTVFQEGAGIASMLYRGHKAFEYNQPHNGTCYWESPVYEPGTVVYNGKLYRGVLLNIDAARHDLIIHIEGGVSNKVLERKYVRECTIGGRHFLNLQNIHGEAAPAGYWEVLFEGRNTVLRRVDKKLEQDMDGRRRDEARYEGAYKSHVYQIFVYSDSLCCVTEDGRVVPVRRRSDLLRLLDPAQRREFRRSIRRRESSGRISLDQYSIALAQYLEAR